MVDPTGHFAALMSGSDFALDEAAFAIAAHANPTLNLRRELSRLEELAGEVSEATPASLCATLFGRFALRGDRSHYDDPRNSFLDQVLDRRLGIPISLSVLMIEVGRRCGIALDGVGMPGHFLVRSRDDPSQFYDAFSGGRSLDEAGCRRLFSSLAGPGVELDPVMLGATSRVAIIQRMLANLDNSYHRRDDNRSLSWVLRLRLSLPHLSLGERVELAGRLGELGRYAEASSLLSGLADACEESRLEAERALADPARYRAVALRARLN
jgi:regulator of sirC expression with transglutaminase-like and TPR domain